MLVSGRVVISWLITIINPCRLVEISLYKYGEITPQLAQLVAYICKSTIHVGKSTIHNPGMMYFPSKWGAKEPLSNPQNHRVIMDPIWILVTWLVVSFIFHMFTPIPGEKWFNLTKAYFSNGLVNQPPTSYKWSYIYTSSSRASRWRKFQKKKELYSKERICL